MRNIIVYLMFSGWLFISCATTTAITSTWKAPDAAPRTFDKLMVLGLIRDADRSIQQNMENHLVGDLKELGYNAYSALKEYGPKAFENLTEEQANQKLKSSGFDGVLTIVLLDKKQERYYVPGRVIYTPYFTYHTRFWGYYRTIYERIETPGYYSSYSNYFWESNLYDLDKNKLLYSIQTRSFEPSSREELAHEYGKLIVKSLVTNNLLIKQSTGGAKAM